MPEKWRHARDVPTVSTFHLLHGLHPFQFEVGDHVRWETRFSPQRVLRGTGVIIDRYYMDVGMSSPADYYLVKNDGDVPYPFLDEVHWRTFDLEPVTDPTVYEFICGRLEKV